jgi:lysophosphatidate acyltransferase
MNFFIIVIISFSVGVQLGMQSSSKARFLVRASLMALAMLLSNSITLLSAIILVPLGQGMRLNSMLAYWARVLIPLLTGIHGEIVEGEENLKPTDGKPVIYLLNHQSTLDLLFMSYVIPPGTVFTAKKEVKYIPLMGQIFVAGKNILIDRKNRSSAVEAMQQVADRMKKDSSSVAIFPEGTRSNQKDGSLLPFKKGAFHLAKQTGYKIIPIVASTYYPLYHEKSMLFERGIFQIKGTNTHMIP